MKHKVNLTLVLIIGLLLAIGCANSGSNNAVSTPKPQSFTSAPANSNYSNFDAGRTAPHANKKPKKKTVKQAANLSEADVPPKVENRVLTAPPVADDGYYHLGPRGGCYVWTSGGKKRYVDRSLCH